MGVDPDLHAPIAEASPLSGVVSGSFLVNGVSISLDVSEDSISSVFAAINASDAGVNTKLFEVSRQTQDLVDAMNKPFEIAGARPLPRGLPICEPSWASSSIVKSASRSPRWGCAPDFGFRVKWTGMHLPI